MKYWLYQRNYQTEALLRTLEDGFAVILCDLDMVIIETLLDKNTNLRITENGYLHQLILKDNLSRFLEFLFHLKQEKSAFGHEISIVDGYDQAKIMNFGGIEYEGHYIVALFQNQFGFYERLIGSKDLRINLLKEEMKSYYVEATNYNHLTELNNQFLNIQRELTQKNIEIARLLTQTEAINRELQEAHATKDRIFSVIGHDLRAPLASVIDCMNLMSMDQITYEALVEKNLFELLKQSAGNSMILLENLLEWSRCQIGEITFNPVEVNLATLMKEVTAHFKEVVIVKKINFSEDYLDDPIVMADQRMLGTVMRNLVSNAIKFSEQEGHIYIKVVNEQNSAKLIVRDEGIGMTEERIEGLFNTKNTSVVPGTFGEKGVGFGVSLCKYFMDQNGGTISVSSCLGKGSTFTITIPLV